MTLPDRTPSMSDQDTLGFVMEIFNEARGEKRKYLDRWNRYYRAFRNRTWSEHRASWLPSPSSSELFPSYHTIVAWMTDQRPVMFCSPRPNKELKPGNHDPQQIITKAGDMRKTLASWWNNRGVGAQLEQSLFDCFNFGAGIMKTGWDQSMEQGVGDGFLRRIDPYNCLNDPNACGLDDSRYFLEVTRVPLFEVRTRFPERGHLVGADEGRRGSDERPRASSGFNVVPMANPAATGVTGQFPGTATAGIPPRFGYPGFQGSEDYTKTVLLVEAWVKTTESYTIPHIEAGAYVGNIELERPIWQYVAVANGVVLTPDVSNPFAHGQLPYVRLPMCEIGEFWSIPLTEHVGPAQIALNRLLAAMQTNAELLGNPILLEDQEAGISRTKIINRPGGRITKNAGSEVRWLDPPDVSATLANLPGFWSDRIDRITGISSVARGTSLRRREPAAAVDAVQEASFVRVRAILRNMEEALRLAGNQIASNLVQFYIEPRAVSLTGPTGSEGFLDLGPRHFFVTIQEDAPRQVPLDFDIWIEAGSTLPISRGARAAEADNLFAMGVIDDEALLEAHDWPDRKAILERAVTKRVTGQMPQPGGAPQTPGG